MGISFLLFRRNNRIHAILWWPLLGAMVLLLPVAPFVLTDEDHLITKIRVIPPPSVWATILFYALKFGNPFIARLLQHHDPHSTPRMWRLGVLVKGDSRI